MPAIPPTSDFNKSTIDKDTFHAKFLALHAYLTGLLASSGNAVDARSQLGLGSAATAEATAFAKTLLDDVDAATARETLGASPSTRAYAEYSVYNGYTGVIPLDDTIPQNTEGDEIVTVSITPKSATSRLRVRVIVGCMTANAAISIIGALFRDATANAVKAVHTELPAAGELSQLQLEHEEASGSTAATTFKFRMGTPGGTYWVNGSSTARLFGGVASVSIIVEEI